MKRGKVSLGMMVHTRLKAALWVLPVPQRAQEVLVAFELPRESFDEADIWNETSAESQE